MNTEHWRFPMSSADPAVVDKSVAGMETSLRNAKLWGAGVVLLVPAVVDPQTSYDDAWTRSQQVIRERILPLAAELKVVVAVEEVWNKFLLSPLEMARYVDEFDSPWVKAYFDVGNVVLLRLPAGLDSHAGAAHRPRAPQGLHARSRQGHLRSGRTSARATSTGRRCARPWPTSTTTAT